MDYKDKYNSLFLLSYYPAPLELLNSLNLLNRYDSKFIINQNLLPAILHSLRSEYNILDIKGLRIFQYNNLYFDTYDYLFYNQHHNGKLNRVKIRYRNYADTNTCFFEIKRKTNGSKTIKDRIKVKEIERQINGQAGTLVTDELSLNPDNLLPKLQVDYKRMTLINPMIQEKITIDTEIKFKNTVNSYELNGLALLEIKQKKVNHLTPSMNILKKLIVHENSGLSKYCLGLVLTDSVMKYNKFKSKLLIINRLLSIEDRMKYSDWSIN